MIIGRRVVLALAAVIVVASGWYAYRHDAPMPDAPLPGERLLAYVPSDTVFFVGYTRALPTGKLVSAWHDVMHRYLREASALDPRHASAEGGPAAGLLVGLLREQRAALEREGWPFAILGFPPAGVIAAYTVDGIPVLRWQLTDPASLWRTLSAAEQAAGIQARAERHGRLRLRRYTLDIGEHRQSLRLIFATGDDFALALLAPGSADGKALEAALGVTRPADPLVPIQLNTLAWTYGLMPGTVGFVDNRRLLAPLSEAPSDNGLVELISSLIAASGAEHPWLAMLRSPDCREDLALIPDFWPRSVVGLTGLGAMSGRLSQRVVIETDQQRILAELEDLRGHIPTLVRSPRIILGLGFGLDFPALAPATEALDSPYGGTASDCPTLAAAQRRLARRSETAAPDAVAALLTHANGIGAVVSGLRPTADPAMPAKVDGGLVVATERPEDLWQTLEPTTGFDIRTPAEPGGGPIAASPRFAEGETIRVVLREQALALLVGSMELPKPAAEGSTGLAPNGLFAFRYRYGPHSDAMAAAADPWLAPLPAAEQRLIRRLLGVLQAMHVSLAVDVDVGDTGFEIDISVTPAN